MIARLFNKSAAAEYVTIGDQTVAIPKLTVEKWKALFGVIESLPQIIVSVLSSRNTSDFTATAVLGVTMAFDEAVKIVAILADLEPEYVAKEATLNDLFEFIRLTAEKNDLQRTVKNFNAVLGQLTSGLSGGNPNGG